MNVDKLNSVPSVASVAIGIDYPFDFAQDELAIYY
jgi:hypothetical protein